MHFLKLIDNVGKIKEDKKYLEPDHLRPADHTPSSESRSTRRQGPNAATGPKRGKLRQPDRAPDQKPHDRENKY